jgi:hypothetical protein
MAGNAPIFRLATHLVASMGVSKVLNDIIVNNTNVVTTADAVRVWTGAIVIGSMIADHASKHVNDRIDAVLAWNQARKTSTPTEE